MTDPYLIRERNHSGLEAVRGINDDGEIVWGPEAIPANAIDRCDAAIKMKRAGATRMQWLRADLSLNGVHKDLELERLAVD